MVCTKPTYWTNGCSVCLEHCLDWWQQFWIRHQQNTGDTPEEARRKLWALLGKNYQQRPVCDLYLRDLLRKHEDGGLVSPETLIERAKDAPPRPPEEERPRRDGDRGRDRGPRR